LSDRVNSIGARSPLPTGEGPGVRGPHTPRRWNAEMRANSCSGAQNVRELAALPLPLSRRERGSGALHFRAELSPERTL